MLFDQFNNIFIAELRLTQTVNTFNKLFRRTPEQLWSFSYDRHETGCVEALSDKGFKRLLPLIFGKILQFRSLCYCIVDSLNGKFILLAPGSLLEMGTQ